jgi:hypothetical protein
MKNKCFLFFFKSKLGKDLLKLSGTIMDLLVEYSPLRGVCTAETPEFYIVDATTYMQMATSDVSCSPKRSRLTANIARVSTEDMVQLSRVCNLLMIGKFLRLIVGVYTLLNCLC